MSWSPIVTINLEIQATLIPDPFLVRMTHKYKQKIYNKDLKDKTWLLYWGKECIHNEIKCVWSWFKLKAHTAGSWFIKISDYSAKTSTWRIITGPCAKCIIHSGSIFLYIKPTLHIAFKAIYNPQTGKITIQYKYWYQPYS